jgi:hypothetical protein
VLAVVDGREQPGSEQLRQLAGVYSVRLVTVLEQAVLARVADDDSITNLPSAFKTAMQMLALCTSSPT